VTRAAAIALGLALCLCTGCFVFDEIDQGRKLMKKHSGQNPHVVQQPDAAAEPDESDEGPGLLARVQQLIQDYREPDDPERPADDEIVRCELAHGLTFTHESDCLSRGGAVL
jgi:hypothetical protein